MAGSSLLMLLDDIASVLDDVAILTKVAAKKTSGVLGDDLALNAQQVTGVSADRELPVVWAVAKGSLINKLILAPLALIISFYAPKLITPLLMIGGLYLCFEGAEKVWHLLLKKFHPNSSHDNVSETDNLATLQLSPEEIIIHEKKKIKGAIKTDFILSAEIITITLGTIAEQAISTQIYVLLGVSLLMTIGVYGLVAGIVKIDDLGIHWLKSKKVSLKKMGQFLLKLAPSLMRTLSVVGTAAMFLVGGNIFIHGIPSLHHLVESASTHLGIWPSLVITVFEGLIGLICGSVILLNLTAFKRISSRP